MLKIPRMRRGSRSLTNREGRQSNRGRMRRNRNRGDESENEDNQHDQQPNERPGTRRQIVTDDDYARIFENAQYSIEMQTCNTCNEQFFDIGVINDVCSACRKSAERGTFNLFTADNGMDPGIFH